MPDVTMPRLSDSMEEGTILKWLKSDGDEVSRGDELVEIETDKANMTYEADLEGVLKIVAQEGDTLPVGQTIAQIGGDGGGGGREQPAEEPQEPADGEGERVQQPEPAGSGRGAITTEDLTRLQQTIARRMAESKATAPDFVITCEVDMDAAVEFRKQLKAAAGEDPAPSFNDFVVKASALALKEFPRANGAYRDGKFELYSRVNVGIAVAGQDALIVPTIFDADNKSLGQISRDARALAERVRAGKISPPELSSGTFSVSNLGMFGIKRFTAVINQPQAAILAVGEMTHRPVVRDGEITVRAIMELTLTCDHRILYGADAAQFLGRIRERLENPLSLAL